MVNKRTQTFIDLRAGNKWMLLILYPFPLCNQVSSACGVGHISANDSHYSPRPEWLIIGISLNVPHFHTEVTAAYFISRGTSVFMTPVRASRVQRNLQGNTRNCFNSISSQTLTNYVIFQVCFALVKYRTRSALKFMRSKLHAAYLIYIHLYQYNVR